MTVFATHIYPLEYARTYIRLCHLRSAAGTNTIYSTHGIVCLYQGQRRMLMEAQRGFLDALSIVEAIATALLTADDAEATVVSVDQIFEILNECFSGCIQTSVRLDMYAQALAFSERAHSYSIMRALLEESCRRELLKGLPAQTLKDFKELTTKLSKHVRTLRLDVPSSGSSGNVTRMLQVSVQMVQLLNDMAAHAEICSNEKLHLLGLVAPKVKDAPCVWQEDPVQDSDSAVLEFYISDFCAYAFVKCRKEHCPRTIEYTIEQIRLIKASVDAVELPKGTQDDEKLMKSLVAVAEALKVDTLLNAIPITVQRLIIVPHGPLMIVPLHLLPLGKSVGVFDVTTAAKSSVQDIQVFPFDRLLMDRFRLGIIYTASINLYSWLQSHPMEKRFAPMLQSLVVGRPRGAENIPPKDIFDGELRCFRQIFKQIRGVQDIDASEYSLTVDPKEQAAAEADKETEKKIDKKAVWTRNADILHFSCRSFAHYDRNCDKMDMSLHLAGSPPYCR
jgi:hypothetical protein